MKILSGKAILIGLLLGLVAACGSNGSGDTSYDTKTNPRNFPQLALDLLDNIDSGQLAEYDAIVNAFGQLYMDHSDLLDNTAWQSIVNQLGHHFRQRADSLAGEGVQHYSTAAGMYILASFARPDDAEIKHLSRLFGVWVEGVEDTSLAVYKDIKGRSNLAYQIDRTRGLMFGSDLQREFAESYLIEQALRPLTTTDPSAIEQLSLPRRVFLASVGLADFAAGDAIVGYGKPECALVAYELLPIERNSFAVEDSFRVEVYFVPAEPLAEDYTIAFWLNMGHDESAGHLPFDFAPPVPSTQWRTGAVAAAGHSFYFDGDFASLSFGLYVMKDDQAIYLPVEGADGPVARVPIRQ